MRYVLCDTFGPRGHYDSRDDVVRELQGMQDRHCPPVTHDDFYMMLVYRDDGTIDDTMTEDIDTLLS